MANEPILPPVARVVLSLHNLYVEIEHEGSYPDQLSDLGNRAFELFTSAMQHAKDLGMDIRARGYEEYEDYEDED
jgi:hypothetical protein